MQQTCHLVVVVASVFACVTHDHVLHADYMLKLASQNAVESLLLPSGSQSSNLTVTLSLTCQRMCHLRVNDLLVGGIDVATCFAVTASPLWSSGVLATGWSQAAQDS